MQPKHFISTQDYSQDELQHLIDLANQFKSGLNCNDLQNKSIALLFFNPSLRTRTSFELGAWQLGGKAIVLEPGKNAWPLEFDFAKTMDGDAEEHVIEAAKVLSEYCDLIAIRAFPQFNNWQDDKQDKIIQRFAQYASVPVINMETITHPCQELAHMQMLQNNLGNVKNKKYLLTWTYHPKPLNSAVANSSILIASKFGMDITLLCPEPSYLLDNDYLQQARSNISTYGGSLTVTHDIQQAYADADVVYAKSWGSLEHFGNWESEKKIRDQYKHFIVDEEKMAITNRALFSHCLPLRRNIKATDGVVDADYSKVIEEAANRLHVQKALMTQLFNS
ncbi:N-acetylornithine carbamoyltransferase [Aliikangiella sp. IMCC44653]